MHSPGAAKHTPNASPHAHHWTIDRGVDFLNHGSFGACPTPVLEAQGRWRERMERRLVQFLVRDLEGLMDEARAAVGGFVGASADDLAFVPNATAGVNTVLRSLRFEPGDELLTTNHEYNACANALRAAAERWGARVVIADVAFPIESPGHVVGAVVERVTPRTRLLLIDHVTSPTALVFPAQRLVREMAQRGIDTLVDGAHAPGMIDIDIEAIGAAYYTGNLHKWVCAPKGAAFLYVRRDRHALIRPLSISHGANSTRADRPRFRLEFDWTGTADPTAFLSAPEAIRFMGSLLPGGWDELRRSNREKALAARRSLCAALGVAPPAPDEMIGAIATVQLPDGSLTPNNSSRHTDPLQEALLSRHAIEVPIMAWPAPPKRMVRISAQVYNRAEQYERLGKALAELLGGESGV